MEIVYFPELQTSWGVQWRTAMRFDLSWSNTSMIIILIRYVPVYFWNFTFYFSCNRTTHQTHAGVSLSLVAYLLSGVVQGSVRPTGIDHVGFTIFIDHLANLFEQCGIRFKFFSLHRSAIRCPKMNCWQLTKVVKWLYILRKFVMQMQKMDWQALLIKEGDLDKYLERMARKGVWGDGIMIEAAAL